MRLPEGFYVLHQPKYRTPNVFDLHDRGKFEWRPPVIKEYGFRLIADDKLNVRVQYFHLRQRDVVHAGSSRRCKHVVDEVLLDLNEALEPDSRQIEAAIDRIDVREDLQKMLTEWRAAFVQLREDGAIDRSELGRKIAAVVGERKKILRNELVRKNGPWISLCYSFESDLALPVLDNLHREYRNRGGEYPPEDLLERILLFNFFCDTEN